MRLGTHAGKLERWLGPDVTEHLSRSMANWYGPPIAVGGVPGAVWAMPGGDFRGTIRAGQMSSALDYASARLASIIRTWARGQMSQANVLGSWSDVIAAAAANKGREFYFSKTGTTGVAGVSNSLWGLGNYPPAGANASNAPGGDVPTDATSGTWPFVNPTGGDTQHFIYAQVTASAVNTLLLYDRLFQVNKTMNSTATEAVTGVPTRYQSTTAGDPDYIGGNFLFVEVGGTALAATAHNWTVCTYLDQADAASTLPSLTGNSGAIVRRLDHPVNQWFAPLQTGDVGIKALTQMQCSAAVATGVVNFVIGHPIAWMPCPIANVACVTDGLRTAFNMVRVFDDACLALMETMKPATAATTYNGMFRTIAG